MNRPPSNPDAVQAFYWNGPLSRKEAQKIFDDLGQACNALMATVTKLDLAVAFLMDRMGVTPQDFAQWHSSKIKELEALQVAQGKEQTPTESESSLRLS